MDGLECNEILFSQLENSFTLGAEYYSKEFVRIVNTVKGMNHTFLSDASRIITDGDHGSPDYQEEGILYLLSECIKSGYIDLNKSKRITEEKHKELKRSALHPGDVVVTKTGVNFGISAVIPDDFEECNTIAHVGKITLKKGYNPYIISAFLNSKYGYYQMRRRGLKATRPEMKLVEMQDILIPIFKSDDLGNVIKRAIEQGYELLRKAERKYFDAEKLLLDEIGIDMYSITSGDVSVKSFAESFESTGRLDAEYYHPKYDRLFSAISKIPHKKLEDIVCITKSIEPGSDAYMEEGIPFIRVSDVSKFEISKPDKYLEPGGAYDLANYYLRKNEILFSKDGSVGIAYKVEQDAKMISSSALLHLRIKKPSEVLPDYLTAVLNSEVVQLQAERDAGGSIIKHWKPSEIKKVLIPILAIHRQKEISSKAIQSFELRYKSKQLFKCVKEAMEMAIEQDELTATIWLESKITEFSTN